MAHSSARSKSVWSSFETADRCSTDTKLKYLSGNALTDDVNCVGPNDSPYPRYTYIVTRDINREE